MFEEEILSDSDISQHFPEEELDEEEAAALQQLARGGSLLLGDSDTSGELADRLQGQRAESVGWSIVTGKCAMACPSAVAELLVGACRAAADEEYGSEEEGGGGDEDGSAGQQQQLEAADTRQHSAADAAAMPPPPPRPPAAAADLMTSAAAVAAQAGTSATAGSAAGAPLESPASLQQQQQQQMPAPGTAAAASWGLPGTEPGGFSAEDPFGFAAAEAEMSAFGTQLGTLEHPIALRTRWGGCQMECAGVDRLWIHSVRSPHALCLLLTSPPARLPACLPAGRTTPWPKSAWRS